MRPIWEKVATGSSAFPILIPARATNKAPVFSAKTGATVALVFWPGYG